MPKTDPRPRLFLIAPDRIDPDQFAPMLDSALSAGDVASLLIAPRDVEQTQAQRIAEALVPVAQRHGAAALVANDTRIAGRARADGIHLDDGAIELKDAIERFHPKNIVGIGNISTRHDAMIAGETGADYLLFGKTGDDAPQEPHPGDLELGEWWTAMFEPPCVVMAGSDLRTIDAVLETGTEFIGLKQAVWDHPDGAAAAVRAANDRIDAFYRDAP